MALTDGTGLSAADIMALTGNGNNDGFGMNGSGGWWLLLFILLLGGGFRGWGGYGNGNGCNCGGNGTGAYSYAAAVQNGFDQQALMTALTNLNTVVANGFSSAAVDACNKSMTILQGQNALGIQMANYEMARQMSTCDVKSAISDLKATVLSENCADRTALNESTNNIITAMNAGFQGIKDQLFQNQLDAMKQENENLRMQNYIRSISDSNNQQTQQLFANNQAQTDRIMDFLNPPYARPYYGNNGGCCCNNNFNPCCGNS